MSGTKIINALKEAIAGDLARVWIDGVCWEPRRKWEYIETAPKDRTRVLLYCPCGNRPFVGRRVFEGYFGFNGTFQAWFKSESGYPVFPTLWMPLPEPPEGDQ